MSSEKGTVASHSWLCLLNVKLKLKKKNIFGISLTYNTKFTPEWVLTQSLAHFNFKHLLSVGDLLFTCSTEVTIPPFKLLRRIFKKYKLV